MKTTKIQVTTLQVTTITVVCQMIVIFSFVPEIIQKVFQHVNGHAGLYTSLYFLFLSLFFFFKSP